MIKFGIQLADQGLTQGCQSLCRIRNCEDLES